MVTVTDIAVLSAIVFVASIVRGFTGFGLALVAVPLTQFFLPVTDTAVYVALINLSFSILYYRRSREIVKGQPLGAMALATIAGVAAGTMILRFVNPSYIQLLWGCLIIFIVVFLAGGYHFRIRSERNALTLSGIFGGLLAGSTGITGPPVAIILSSVNTPKEKFNALISIFILFAVTCALILYLITGLIRREVVIYAISTIPALLLGLYTGDKLASRVSQKWFTRVVYAVLIVMGAVTIIKGYRSL